MGCTQSVRFDEIFVNEYSDLIFYFPFIVILWIIIKQKKLFPRLIFYYILGILFTFFLMVFLSFCGSGCDETCGYYPFKSTIKYLSINSPTIIITMIVCIFISDDLKNT